MKFPSEYKMATYTNDVVSLLS